MARPGQIISNPLTGETFTFLKTARDTGGQLLQFEFIVRPGGAVPYPHIHENQKETFEITQGKATFIVDGKKVEAKAGDTVVVPMGTEHICLNDQGEELRAIVSFEPDYDLEIFFETFCGLGSDGIKCDKTGGPNLLQIVVSLSYHRFKAYRTDIPKFVQKVVGPVLIQPVARMLSYRAIYEKYSGFIFILNLERLYLCLGILFFGVSGLPIKDWRTPPNQSSKK